MPRPRECRPCLLDIVTWGISDGTQCHNIIHACIGNVLLPARRHGELRGEPVVRFLEILLSKVNQLHVAPRVAYRLRPTLAPAVTPTSLNFFSHQACFKIGLRPAVLGIYKLFKSPVVMERIEWSKRKRNECSVSSNSRRSARGSSQTVAVSEYHIPCVQSGNRAACTAPS